jgi:hypothetical protein
LEDTPTSDAAQQVNTATLPSNIDLIRSAKIPELHQRPALTSVQLVHTEEVDQAAELVCDSPKTLSFEVTIWRCHTSRPVADLVTLLVPVGAALAGVALTFAGNAWLEYQRWRRTQAGEQQVRILGAFADFLQSVTDIARTLRRSAERLASRGHLDLDALADGVDALIGQARRQGTMVRLMGPSTAFPLIKQVEDVLATLDDAIKSIRGAEKRRSW